MLIASFEQIRRILVSSSSWSPVQEGGDHVYSARIGLDYRALAVMRKDRIVWYWIGNHADYDRLV
ncbi:MAG TPA: hypothetical protein VH640_19990 [Bryobacteraceae bacterium]